MKSHLQTARVTYNDLHLRIIASILAGHFIVIFGTKIRFFQAIMMPHYYIALAGSAIISFSLVSTIYCITSWLDKRYDWYDQPYQRSAYQFLFGIVISALLAFALAAFYFYLRGINILDTLYLIINYPVIVLLLILNAYYLIHYLVKTGLADKTGTGLPISPLTHQPEARGMFVVKGVHDTKLVPTGKIRIFYVDQAGLNLVYYHNLHIFCPYLKITDVIKKLDRDFFFQVNAQTIVHISAIESYTVLTNNTLGLTLNFPFNYPVVVSQSRTPAFWEWIHR